LAPNSPIPERYLLAPGMVLRLPNEESMKYRQLDSTYKEDVIAEALYARELEHFHYDFDKKNFEHMLQTTPRGEDRKNLEQRLASTILQMKSVEDVYAALLAQITDKVAHEAAIQRAIKKRNEEKP
jgi:hypothetical protein